MHSTLHNQATEVPKHSTVTAPLPQPAIDNQSLFAVVRSAALLVVVAWHWIFATIRWDEQGPHSGNPLHAVPGGFLLTWVLQVMPVFFFVGAWGSLRSLDRALSSGTTARRWVLKRVKKLVIPVLPLVAVFIAATRWGSPSLRGIVLLAVSPLWFLGVYLPLMLLTPLLRVCHRRFPMQTVGLMVGAVLALQHARFALGFGGLLSTLLSFLLVWGTVFQLGFFLEEIVSSRRLSALGAIVGAVGLAAGPRFGYSLSMVTTSADTRSNMGPPTVQIVFLAVLQIGLLGLFRHQLCGVTRHRKIRQLLDFVQINQMSIYAIHLPIWVGVLVALRSTPLALSSTADAHWLLTRPIWLLVPGVLLAIALRFISSRTTTVRPECPCSVVAMAHSPLRLDHLVYATTDLSATSARLAEALGVTPCVGGQHVGRGTRNELLSLGEGAYLEIIGPDPDQPAPLQPRPFGVDDLVGEKLVAWAVSTPSIDDTLRAIHAAGGETERAHTMSRQTPNGDLLEWRLTMPVLEKGIALIPFVIDWCSTPAALHPSETSPRGCSLISFSCSHPYPDAVRNTFHAMKIDMSVELGEIGLSASIQGVGSIVTLT